MYHFVNGQILYECPLNSNYSVTTSLDFSCTKQTCANCTDVFIQHTSTSTLNCPTFHTIITIFHSQRITNLLPRYVVAANHNKNHKNPRIGLIVSYPRWNLEWQLSSKSHTPSQLCYLSNQEWLIYLEHVVHLCWKWKFIRACSVFEVCRWSSCPFITECIFGNHSKIQVHD